MEGALTVQGEARMLIDGKLVEAGSGKTFQNINPATEEPIGEVADGSADDMRRAIEAARRAFDETGWAADRALRRRCLEQLQRALEEAKEELRQVLVAEGGSPIMLTYAFQVDLPIADFAWAAEMAGSYEFETWLAERERFGAKHRRLVRREPVGVVGAITPWNFPLYLNLAKLGPALAAGNAVVLKPAPDTPWTATVMGRLVAERTDIPAGIVNIVTSSDHLVGEVLTTDPRVDMITFTGSTATGRRIMACGAPTVKKVFLELGGKSANVVLDDADLETAVKVGVSNAFLNGGQTCTAWTRLVVPAERYSEAVELAASFAGRFSPGDPTDEKTRLGPMVNAAQRDRVRGLIDTAVAEGARVVVGGSEAPDGMDAGYYVRATVLADVDPDSTVAQTEVFGPVLSVLSHTGDDDAVAIANNSEYGLHGGVWSADPDRARAVARRIRTGTVDINGAAYSPTAPFGGYKHSGVGREMGQAGLEEYLEIKAIGLP